IFEVIYRIDPNITKSADALRGSLQKKNTELIYFGRNSTYGLEVWEYEKENIKGGTIRSIVFDYLSNKDTPVHFSEITELVLKYRPKSNDKSIYNNLRIDESETFIFFKNSYVGLKNK